MDIVCAKCGRHFSSIGSARLHYGHCKETAKNEELHWISPQKNEITPEQWDELMKALKSDSFNQKQCELSDNKHPFGEPLIDLKFSSVTNDKASKKIEKCPSCQMETLTWNAGINLYECSNVECNRRLSLFMKKGLDELLKGN